MGVASCPHNKRHNSYSCLRLFRMTSLLPIMFFFFASFLLVFPTPSTSTPTTEQNFQPLGPLPKRAGYYAYMQKRGGYCIGFGRSCSTKGITCCGENICKCNLFRTNCRCQRSGLFGRR